MSGLVLILGGARSGKSAYAESLAAESSKVVYFATAEPGDAEMTERIERHRERRPPGWKTVVTPLGLPKALRDEARGADVAIVDCLTLYVSNLMGAGFKEEEVLREIEDLIGACREVSADVVLVSNEVGLGIVPANGLARAFRDVLGRCNRVLAEEADEVSLMVAGIPLKVKGNAHLDSRDGGR